MSIRIIEDSDGYKCLYDSVTMTAFGVVFMPDEDAEEFLEWIGCDARILTHQEFEHKLSQWRNK